jgi:hypothetical protein
MTEALRCLGRDIDTPKADAFLGVSNGPDAPQYGEGG